MQLIHTSRMVFSICTAWASSVPHSCALCVPLSIATVVMNARGIAWAASSMRRLEACPTMCGHFKSLQASIMRHLPVAAGDASEARADPVCLLSL